MGQWQSIILLWHFDDLTTCYVTFYGGLRSDMSNAWFISKPLTLTEMFNSTQLRQFAHTSLLLHYQLVVLCCFFLSEADGGKDIGPATNFTSFKFIVEYWGLVIPVKPAGLGWDMRSRLLRWPVGSAAAAGLCMLCKHSTLTLDSRRCHVSVFFAPHCFLFCSSCKPIAKNGCSCVLLFSLRTRGIWCQTQAKYS